MMGVLLSGVKAGRPTGNAVRIQGGGADDLGHLPSVQQTLALVGGWAGSVGGAARDGEGGDGVVGVHRTWVGACSSPTG